MLCIRQECVAYRKLFDGLVFVLRDPLAHALKADRVLDDFMIVFDLIGQDRVSKVLLSIKPIGKSEEMKQDLDHHVWEIVRMSYVGAD